MSTERSDSEAFITIGKVQKPRGIFGEVFFAPLTDFPERFWDLKEVLVERPDGARRTLRIEALRDYGKRLTIKFEGYDTPEAVDRWRGSFLLVSRDRVHPLPEDTFYVFDLIGLRVETEAGEEVGRVVDVVSAPGNDVYVVDRGGNEFLVPAVREWVRVDVEGGRIVVRDIEGLA